MADLKCVVHICEGRRGREEGRKGGREGGREGGRKEGREGGRERKRGEGQSHCKVVFCQHMSGVVGVQRMAGELDHVSSSPTSHKLGSWRNTALPRAGCSPQWPHMCHHLLPLRAALCSL